MKTLYLTDLDGTLLTRNDRLTTYTIETINELVAGGMCFSFATARSLLSARVVTEGLQLKLPVIVYNGALMVDYNSGEALHALQFTPEQIREVVEQLNSCGAHPLVYAHIGGKQRVSWLGGSENEGVLHYLRSRKGDPRLRECGDREELFTGEIFYFTCIGEEAALASLAAYFRGRDGYTCTFQQELYRAEYWCEIMPGEATKGVALKRLKRITGCDRVVSFGDAVNDLAMFAASDECYAVAGAVEALKAAATGVIGHNGEDSVARWLLHNYHKN